MTLHRSNPIAWLPVFPLAALAWLGACGPGGAGQAARPNDPTAAGALEEGECRDVSGQNEPLVVDWKPEQRGDLEIAMREGVAVVSYSCKGMKLLKECKLDGSYGFMGMTKKEQVVRLNNSDELRANLPLSGVQLGAELKRGASIDVAMVMVGRQKTTWAGPTKEDLKGTCDGATHYVRGAMVGAFAMDTNTSGEAKAFASFFGAGTSGASASKKQVQNKEGDISACGKSSPTASSAPEQCGAPIRLLIAPIAAKAAEPAAEKKPAEEHARVEAACPAGLVFADGKCTKAESAKAYQCKTDDAKECAAQCDKGHAGSCGALGVLHATGSGAAQDPAKAAQLFDKGCTGGDIPSCVNLGRAKASGRGVAEDAKGAAELFDKGCQNGDALGCALLGEAAMTGQGADKDTGRAAGLFKQACDGGHDKSCGKAAQFYATGDGVSQDTALATELFKRACTGSDGASCAELARLYVAARNNILAEMYAHRGCMMGNADSCLERGALEHGKPTGKADAAKRFYDMGCMRQSEVACAVLKAAFGENKPVIPNAGRMMEWRRACDKGNSRACTRLGIMSAGSGNKAGGLMDLRRACATQDAWACALEKALK